LHHPYGIVFDGANIWVTNTGDNTVTKLRATDGVLLGTFQAGTNPGTPAYEVAFDGANIWVTNGSANTVTELRATDGVILGTFPTGQLPQGVLFDGANIWVTNANGNTVTTVVDVTFAGLVKLVKQFDTKPDVAAIMVATLEGAQAAANVGAAKLADALLQAFIDEVSEQSGKSLTAAQAAILIQYATALKM
jgi:DNA-binding beta-propeller fold protein YncE